MLTERFSHAFDLAAKAHFGQTRKGTAIPYISHPMAVASIALEYGADEDQAIAALLHDAVEDGGAVYAQTILETFGSRVSAIVNGCTDGVPGADGKKGPWEERKANYLRHLRSASHDILLVSGADKLHNVRSIVADLEAIGIEVFRRFSSPMDRTIWYYESLANIYLEKDVTLAGEINRGVISMKRLAMKR